MNYICFRVLKLPKETQRLVHILKVQMRSKFPPLFHSRPTWIRGCWQELLFSLVHSLFVCFERLQHPTTTCPVARSLCRSLSSTCMCVFVEMLIDVAWRNKIAFAICCIWMNMNMKAESCSCPQAARCIETWTTWQSDEQLQNKPRKQTFRSRCSFFGVSTMSSVHCQRTVWNGTQARPELGRWELWELWTLRWTVWPTPDLPAYVKERHHCECFSAGLSRFTPTLSQWSHFNQRLNHPSWTSVDLIGTQVPGTFDSVKSDISCFEIN